MSKYYYLAAVLAFLVGVSGGYLIVKNSQPATTPQQTHEEETRGELTAPPPTLPATPTGGQEEKGVKGVEGEADKPARSAGGSADYLTPYSTPYQTPKPNPCIQAKKDLDHEKAGAQQVYDAEQSQISNRASELSRQRNAAINSYLTGIALATSKYNSATSSDAYAIYQQEQGTALNNYTQTINEITSQEAKLPEEKSASQKKFDEAITAAESSYLAKGCRL